ncbi:MAG: serine protease [Planctomycetota bacterium]|nr:MAG: serine protease [Planctomycetota bacterium]
MLYAPVTPRPLVPEMPANTSLSSSSPSTSSSSLPPGSPTGPPVGGRPLPRPLSSSSATAQPSPRPTRFAPHPAVARLSVADASGHSLGSGTLIYVTAEHGLVLTNWHVVRDAVGPIEVVFADGFRSGGTVLKVDHDWDLAAVGIWRPPVEPVELANHPPQPGERLTIAGWGSGNFREASGRCLQYLSPGDGHPFEIVELGAEARQGDSGGPIFNERGQLAGVLLGAADGRTVGSYCGRVGHFLADVTPVLDHQQKEMIADARQDTHEEDHLRLADASENRLQTLPHGGRQVPNRGVGQSAASGSPNHIATHDLVTIAPGDAADRLEWGELPDLSGGAEYAAAPHDYLAATETSRARTPTRGAAILAADGAIPLRTLIGTTPVEQAKTFLAIFGVISLLFFLLRALTQPAA